MIRRLPPYVATLGALALAACPGRDGATVSRPTLDHPNIVVVDVDSLRADYLSPEACADGYAPSICGRMEGGAWFTQTTSSSGWTLPALDALLSGRHPSAASLSVLSPDPLATSARDGQLQQAPQGAQGPPTLAAALALYGYDTRAFWGSTTGGAAPYLSEGFETVHAFDQAPQTATQWRDAVLDWLETPPQEPFFALVHTLDAHSGLPADGLHLPISGVDREVARKLLGRDMDEIYRELEQGSSTPEALASLRTAYAERVRWYDAQVGWVLDELESHGLLDKTLVVITSNHGEGLSERLPGTHGPPYAETLRVPLLWLEPEARGLSHRIDTPVQLMDLAPSLLDRVGATVPAELDGRSFISQLGRPGQPYDPRPVYAASSWRSMALRDDGWAAVRTPRGERLESEAAGLELYRTSDDLAELHDLAASTPDRTADMSARLDAWVATLRERAESTPLDDDPALAEELNKRGYGADFDVAQPPAAQP